MSLSIEKWGLLSCCFALFACVEPIEGDGEILSEVRSVDDFDKVRTDNSVNVELTMFEDAADPVELQVRADANLHEYIETEVRVGELRIEAPKQLRPTEPMLLSALIADLSEISANNEAEVRVAYLEENNLKIDANNDAVVEVEGEGRRVDLVADNDARVDLRGFAIDDAEVELDNGADVYLCVADEVQGSVDNGAILRVSCGGDSSGVSVSNGGIVVPF